MLPDFSGVFISTEDDVALFGFEASVADCLFTFKLLTPPLIPSDFLPIYSAFCVP
ncbi:hypothetical protein D3C72_2388910 [compost metagenome]